MPRELYRSSAVNARGTDGAALRTRESGLFVRARGMSMDWGFGFGHGVLGVLFWVVILLFIVGAIRVVSRFGGGERQSHTSARQILEERYARGEINYDEFTRKKRDLE